MGFTPLSKTIFYALADDLELDNADLVNSVQRHTKCNAAYCLKLDSEGNQKCRLNYLQDLANET